MTGTPVHMLLEITGEIEVIKAADAPAWLAAQAEQEKEER
jgi:hypothetical protein